MTPAGLRSRIRPPTMFFSLKLRTARQSKEMKIAKVPAGLRSRIHLSYFHLFTALSRSLLIKRIIKSSRIHLK